MDFLPDTNNQITKREVENNPDIELLDTGYLPQLPFLVKIITFLFLTGLLFSLVFYYTLISPPQDFPKNSVLQILPGTSIQEVTKQLYDRSLIRSKTVFSIFMISPMVKSNMIAGDYVFKEPISSFSIASRLASGYFDIDQIKITLPEGTAVTAMAKIFVENIPEFDEKYFLEQASPLEGYLFPDTYFFSPFISEKNIIEKLNNNFKEKIKTLNLANKKDYSLHEILTLASIVELEASGYRDRQMISDILWRRLEIDMPLQVDAVFPYILGKNTFELTTKDLQFNSPYNTYRYRGLPPGPVTNPGLDSIKAVLNPLPNDYFYYLSDKDGVFHYAVTFKEHVANKQKYLR